MNAPSFPPERSAVLLVAEALRPGGMSIYARGLLRGLGGAGLTPRLIAPEPPPAGLLGQAEEAEVRVFPGLHGAFFRPFVFRRLLPWARDERFALVHGLSAFTASACQRLARALEVGFVLSVHHYQDRGELRLGERCRGVLACSEPIRENLVNDARLPKELIHVVPLGVEVPGAAPGPSATEARTPVVATFASLTPDQDPATLLRAASAVMQTRPGACHFLVVGEGPEEPALRRLARELRLEKHLTFSHAGVPHERILAETDVYVQTARREGFGLAVLEAMAWGRPVVATAVGGLISLVRDGQTGFLVPAGDARAVAGKILDLLGDPQRRATMGANGRALAVKEFSLRRMVQRVSEVYARAMGVAERRNGRL